MVPIPAKAGSAVLPLVNVSGKSLPVDTSSSDNSIVLQPVSVAGSGTNLNNVNITGSKQIVDESTGEIVPVAPNPNAISLGPTVNITGKNVDPVVTPDDTVVTPSPTPSATPSPTPSATPTPSPTPTPTPTTTTKATTTSGGSLPYTPASNITGTPVDNSIVASLLKTYLTQDKFKNVLSNLENMVQKEQRRRWYNYNYYNNNNIWNINPNEWYEDIRCKDIPLTCDILQASQCPITCNLRATNYINSTNPPISKNKQENKIEDLNDDCWSIENKCRNDNGNCNMDIVNMCPVTCNKCYIENAQ
jgi:hypothetical protein